MIPTEKAWEGRENHIVMFDFAQHEEMADLTAIY
jgi:hypothetical protein